MSDEILIVGGGFSGLAAGVALAGAGWRVRLLEQRASLGGRARSFVDPTTRSVVDNGQHILMGCYRATIRFLKEIGTLDRIRFQRRLSVSFVDPPGRVTSLDCPDLPSPWHLLVGAVRSRSFTAREKVEVLRLGRALDSGETAQDGSGRLTVEEWLCDLGQSESLRRNFWGLLCQAAMNEDPRRASARVFERVLRLALFSTPEASGLGIPTVGLSDCYTGAARAMIESKGGRVDLGRRVAELTIADGACRGVRLADGERINSAGVLSAVPWFELARLLPAGLVRSDPFFGRLEILRPAPIISINLWFDRRITELDFVGLRGTTVQWLFNKSQIFGSDDNLVSLVLSAAHDHIGRGREDLLGTALHDLDHLVPASRPAKLLHSLIVKERWATFSPTCEAEEVRPAVNTPIPGLYLAGDWTATGLPGTIEGAVQSGYRAAEEIGNRRRGRSEAGA